MMWYPKKAAFRVGNVIENQWDDTNIGNYSMAMGVNTTASAYASTAMGSATNASGASSTAMGYATKASEYFSTAMGYGTTASGWYSTAMGSESYAIGSYSTAMGNGAVAIGSYSTAMGNGAVASGSNSTAMGYETSASGGGSTAMGLQTTASGDYSTAMGSHVSVVEEGSFIIGDRSTTTTLARDTNNRFFARFDGGYQFYTNSAATIGVILNNGQSSWSALSDSSKKENFQPVNSEAILQKISNFNLGTWNYKGQDPSEYRHYGPMAQDFYAAFGHDGIGTIGNDTTLSSADFDGINFIAIQALEKRTAELREENKKLNEEIKYLREIVADLSEKIQGLNLKSEYFTNFYQDK